MFYVDMEWEWKLLFPLEDMLRDYGFERNEADGTVLFTKSAWPSSKFRIVVPLSEYPEVADLLLGVIPDLLENIPKRHKEYSLYWGNVLTSLEKWVDQSRVTANKSTKEKT